VIFHVPTNEVDLKNKTECIKKILSRAPTKEADVKDQGRCKFVGVFSKDLVSILEDGMTSTNGT